MKRAQRMGTVRRVVEDTEKARAEHLAASERRLGECESKLAELERYEAEYLREFGRRAGAGMGSGSVRDYQVFLTRLAEAVRQQTQITMRARAERDAERERWRSAAQRAHSVGRLVDRWSEEDRRLLEQREQRESDERAQRPQGQPERMVK